MDWWSWIFFTSVGVYGLRLKSGYNLFGADLFKWLSITVIIIYLTLLILWIL